MDGYVVYSAYGASGGKLSNMLQLRTKIQVKGLSDLFIDLGKILVGSVIVGFFVPSLNIPVWLFIAGLFGAWWFFRNGIWLLQFSI